MNASHYSDADVRVTLSAEGLQRAADDNALLRSAKPQSLVTQITEFVFAMVLAACVVAMAVNYAAGRM